MSTRSLYRLCGLALILGAMLFAIGNLLHPIDHSLESQAKATWAAAHVTFLVGSVIMALGLPGLYLRQAAHAGRLGLAGFVVLFFGLLSIVPGAWYEAFVVNEVSESTAKAIEGGPGGIFNGIGSIFFLLGPILFGIATLRARVLARAGALITMAATLGLVFSISGALPTKPEGVAIITCTVLYAAGFAWWGRDLAVAAAAASTTDHAMGGVPRHQPETAGLATGD